MSVGVAVTVAPVVALRFVLGAQVYVFAPEAVNEDELPIHIEGADGDIDTVGSAFTVTITVLVLVQPFEAVPVTV